MLVGGFENLRRRYGSAEAAPAPTRLSARPHRASYGRAGGASRSLAAFATAAGVGAVDDAIFGGSAFGDAGAAAFRRVQSLFAWLARDLGGGSLDFEPARFLA